MPKKEDFLQVNIDSNSKKIIRDDFELNEEIIEQVIRGDQRRKDKQEKIKHYLAGIIIIPYIFLLVINCFSKFEIPKSYESLSLIVIGYYFAKNFF